MADKKAKAPAEHPKFPDMIKEAIVALKEVRTRPCWPALLTCHSLATVTDPCQQDAGCKRRIAISCVPLLHFCGIAYLVTIATSSVCFYA